MFAVLALGFLIGMQHALEADHVAAVTSLVSGDRNVKHMVSHGVVWGLGHTLILMIVGGGAVILGLSLEPTFSEGLELCVGVMLVFLGTHVLYRLYRDRIHFHQHRHGDQPPHFHAHSHKGERGHDHSAHQHDHPDKSWVRPLAVGVMHGLAGTAAVVVLTAAAQTTPAMGLAYIGIFGIGSVVGMAVVTAAIAVPLSFTAKALTRVNRAVQALIGTATIGVGGAILARASFFF